MMEFPIVIETRAIGKKLTGNALAILRHGGGA